MTIASSSQAANAYTIPKSTITIPASITNKTILFGVDPKSSTAATLGVKPYTKDVLKSTLFFNCIGNKIYEGQRAVALTVTSEGSGYVALPSTATAAMYKPRATNIVKVAGDLIGGTTICELPGIAALGLCGSDSPPSGSIFTKVWFYVLLFILIIVVIAVIGGVVYWQKNKNK
jgi:hypothetical protein